MGGRGASLSKSQGNATHKSAKNKQKAGGGGGNATQKNTYLSNAELKNISDKQLKKHLAALSKEYYKSGKSMISFGGRNIDDVVDIMMNMKRSRTSMIKDYKSMKKAMGYK